MWAKFRKVAFASLWAFNVNGKHLPKTESKYMALSMVDDKDKQGVTEEHKQAFIKAMELYKKQKNG